MKIQWLFLIGLMVFGLSTTSLACGSNTPEELEARAKAHFERWDIDDNQQLDNAEFLASDGYLLGEGANDASWARLFKDKISLLDVFKEGDIDKSGALSFEEWGILRPAVHFKLRC